MWQDYMEKIQDILGRLAVTDEQGRAIAPEDGFARWTDMACGLPANGSLHLIGNGASAAMASHYAADITKNCGIRAMVFTDCALVTALGNDNGFENAYAVALNRYARQADLLVAISSSGESPNIVNACHEAKQLGVGIVTITGKKPSNTVRKMGMLNFHVPAPSFSLAESAHAVILHHWTDRLEEIHQRI